jgi:hypothetical protein
MKSNSKTPTRKIAKPKTRLVDPKYKQAQSKLLESVRQNFEQIKSVKEQKTLIAD